MTCRLPLHSMHRFHCNPGRTGVLSSGTHQSPICHLCSSRRLSRGLLIYRSYTAGRLTLHSRHHSRCNPGRTGGLMAGIRRSQISRHCSSRRILECLRSYRNYTVYQQNPRSTPQSHCSRDRTGALKAGIHHIRFAVIVPVPGYRNVSGYTEVILPVGWRSVPHAVSIVIQVEQMCWVPEYAYLGRCIERTTVSRPQITWLPIIPIRAPITPVQPFRLHKLANYSTWF